MTAIPRHIPLALSLVALAVTFAWAPSVSAQADITLPEVAAYPAEPITLEEAATRIGAGSPDVRRLYFTLEDYRSQVRGYEGLFDTTIGAQLDLQRASVPTDSGISSGLNTDERYGLSLSISERLRHGTTLSAQLDQSIVRSEYTLSFEGFEDTIVRGPNIQSGLTLLVEQPLLQGYGERINTLPARLTELQLDTSELTLVRTVSSSVSEAFVAMAELQHLWAQAEVQERVYARAEEQLTIATRLVDAGQVAPFELDLIRGRIATAQEALLVTFAAIDAQSSALRQRFGDGPAPLALRPSLDPVVIPERLDGPQLCADAATLSPELAELRSTEASARLAIVEVEDRLRPSLNLRAGLTSNGLEENAFDSYISTFSFGAQTVFAGLLFTMPLGNETQREERVRRELALERVRFDIAEGEREICYAVDGLVDEIALNADRSAVAAYRAELAQRALDAETRLLEHGMSTVQRGLDALDQYEDAELSRARLTMEATQAWWRLAHQTGGVAERWLRLPAQDTTSP